MARTEDTQESNNSKTLLIDDSEIVDDSAVPESELYDLLCIFDCEIPNVSSVIHFLQTNPLL